MTQKLAIRVTLAKDGKTPVREILYAGFKVGELSYVETLEAAMQFVSSLRYEVKR